LHLYLKVDVLSVKKYMFDIKCGEIYFENAQTVKINVCNK